MDNALKFRRFQSDLDAALSYLIGMGIIEKEGDVVEAIEGISKGNLSTFKKTGKYGNGFKTKFQEKYKIDLADFNPDTYNPVIYIKKKSGTFDVPDQLLALVNEEIKNMQLSLDKLSKAASMTVGSLPMPNAPVQDLGLDKNRGHKAQSKKNEPKDNVSKKGR
jgi:hypothetical protein